MAKAYDRDLIGYGPNPPDPKWPNGARLAVNFVIIGGGPTGVELAGALAEIARHTLRYEFDAIDPKTSRIVLIEAGETILPAFPDTLRDFARRALTRLGVEVWEKARVTSVEHDLVEVGDRHIRAHTIMWAAGVAGAPLAQSLSLSQASPSMTAARPLARTFLDLQLPDERAFGEIQRLVGNLVAMHDLLRDARPLHLHGHLPSVESDSTVHLPERGRRDGSGVETPEEPARLLAELLGDVLLERLLDLLRTDAIRVHRGGEILAGVHQRPVQIKENRLVAHRCLSPFSARQ